MKLLLHVVVLLPFSCLKSRHRKQIRYESVRYATTLDPHFDCTSSSTIKNFFVSCDCCSKRAVCVRTNIVAFGILNMSSIGDCLESCIRYTNQKWEIGLSTRNLTDIYCDRTVVSNAPNACEANQIDATRIIFFIVLYGLLFAQTLYTFLLKN